MNSSNTSLATLRNVSLSLQNRQVLQDISLDVESGNILTIIGPNGAGKSTLLRVLLGLQSIDSGSVSRRDGLRVGYVPQKLQIDATLPLTVERFVAMGRRKRVRSTLESLDVSALAKQPVQSISGGQFQRVLLARALVNQPELLILDEPAQGIDVMGQGEYYERIDTLRQEHGFAVVMVSHDLHLVMAKTDQVICLNQHICCRGMPEQVSRHPEYQRLFGSSIDTGLAVYTHDHDHVHDLQGNVVDGEGCQHG